MLTGGRGELSALCVLYIIHVHPNAKLGNWNSSLVGCAPPLLKMKWKMYLFNSTLFLHNKLCQDFHYQCHYIWSMKQNNTKPLLEQVVCELLYSMLMLVLQIPECSTAQWGQDPQLLVILNMVILLDHDMNLVLVHSFYFPQCHNVHRQHCIVLLWKE